MADQYDGMYDRWPVNHLPSDPSRLAYAVTPSDTLDLPDVDNTNPTPAYAKSLYVGTSGNVAVIPAGDKSNNGRGTPVTFLNVPVGFLPVQVRRVMATSTTAQNIVALMD
jgi:hypothetical protein